jgi:hypothetical protein
VAVLRGPGGSGKTELARAFAAWCRQRRSDRLFGELMRLLDGHPLSMRIILPLLDRTGPAEALALWTNKR